MSNPKRLERGLYELECSDEECDEKIVVEAPGTKSAITAARQRNWLHASHLTRKITLCPTHAQERRQTTRRRRLNHPFNAPETGAGLAKRREYLEKVSSGEIELGRLVDLED